MFYFDNWPLLKQTHEDYKNTKEIPDYIIKKPEVCITCEYSKNTNSIFLRCEKHEVKDIRSFGWCPDYKQNK